MNSTFKDGDCDFVLTGEDAILYLFTTYRKLVILLIVPTVVAFGLFGNAALLFVVYRVQDMRTTTNFYLSNLAVSDTMLLSNSAFQYFWTYFAQPIDFSLSPFPTGYMCALNHVGLYLCYFASVFMVILVTFERYLAICHPLTHRLVKGKTWTVGMTAGAWLMSLVLACVGLDVNETEKICIDWQKSDEFKGMSSHIIACQYITKCSWCSQTLASLDFCQFSLAVIVSTFMYGRIIYTLTTRSYTFNSKHDSDKQTKSMMFRARNQIARMLILNGIVFFICLAPFQVKNLDYFFYWWAGFRLYGAEEEGYIDSFGGIAVLLNSAINPILYNISNERYRKAFAEVFGCTKRRS